MPKRLSLAWVVMAVLVAGPASAGITPVFVNTDVKTYSCRELLAAETEQQNLALTYFSGYVDGERHAARFDGRAKGEVIDKVVEHCRSHPAGSVLEAFLQFTP